MSHSFQKLLAPCIAALALLTGPRASAELGQVVPMGDLDRWGIFTLGNADQTDRLSLDSIVPGDLGAAGNGNVTLSANATINGDVYYKNRGTLTVESGATITGSRFNNQDALLNNGADEAKAASEAAAAFAATRPVDNIVLKNTDTLRFNGAPGETVVLNLKCFKMSGNSTFTLNGAANTTYIINVKKQFSLDGHANIVLTGGLDWNDVLFNVRGTGDDVLLSRNSSFQGVLMANKRTVRLRDNAIVRGEIIADTVWVQGSGQVIHPPVVSP
jgi:cytoskeletal protein CcmA (bactofilin family)